MNMPPTTNEALEVAVRWAGSTAGLAHEARVTEETVRYWLAQNRTPRPVARLVAMLMFPGEKSEDFERELATEPAPEEKTA